MAKVQRKRVQDQCVSWQEPYANHQTWKHGVVGSCYEWLRKGPHVDTAPVSFARVSAPFPADESLD